MLELWTPYDTILLVQLWQEHHANGGHPAKPLIYRNSDKNDSIRKFKVVFTQKIIAIIKIKKKENKKIRSHGISDIPPGWTCVPANTTKCEG